MAATATDDQPRRHRRWWWRVPRWLGLILLPYLLILVLAMWFEGLLLYPTWQIPAGDWDLGGIEHEDVWFTAGDGTQLFGWYFPHPDAEAEVVYFHGNGEDLSHMGPYMDALRQRYQIAIFAFDYRGYGRSAGRPHERGLIADGCAAQRYLAARRKLAPDQIVLWGRSIGGAVAVQVAAAQGARALLLERTFTSLPDVAAIHYRWLPVRRLMRNRFDSETAVAEYPGPLLIAHGTHDEIVPFVLGERLFAAAARATPKTFLRMKGVSHNSPASLDFARAVRRFLQSLP